MIFFGWAFSIPIFSVAYMANVEWYFCRIDFSKDDVNIEEVKMPNIHWEYRGKRETRNVSI